MFSKATSLVALAAAAPAFAGVFVTAPVAGTTWTVGTPVEVKWQDDGSTPSLANIGVCDVAIYTGNQFQQTLLQDIGTLDVSVNNTIQFQVTPNIGPSSQAVYFIRFTAATLKDATNPNVPYEAFSAKFSLSGATGTFNETVQAQINGISTGASSPTPSAATSSAPKSSDPASASAPKTSTPATKANSTVTTSSNTSGSASAFAPLSAVAVAAAGAVFAYML